MFHIKPCFFSFMMSIRFCTLSPGLDVGHGQPLSQHGDINKKKIVFFSYSRYFIFNHDTVCHMVQSMINWWDNLCKLKNSLWLCSFTSVTSSAFPSISEYYPACHAVHWLVYLSPFNFRVHCHIPCMNTCILKICLGTLTCEFETAHITAAKLLFLFWSSMCPTIIKPTISEVITVSIVAEIPSSLFPLLKLSSFQQKQWPSLMSNEGIPAKCSLN